MILNYFEIDFQTKQLVFNLKLNNHLVCKWIWVDISSDSLRHQLATRTASQSLKSFANGSQDLSQAMGWRHSHQMSAINDLNMALVLGIALGPIAIQQLRLSIGSMDVMDGWLQGLVTHCVLCVKKQSVVESKTRPEVGSDDQTSGWLCRAVYVSIGGSDVPMFRKSFCSKTVSRRQRMTRYDCRPPQ